MIILLLNLLGWFLASSPVPGEENKPWLAVHLIDSTLRAEAITVVRSAHTEYIIESPRKYTHRFQKTVTILRQGSHEDWVVAPYDKYSEATILDVQLYDAMGSLIRKVKKSEIQDQLAMSDSDFYLDERYLFVKLAGGQYPYTIEYSWEIRNKETMAYPLWQPAEWDQSVEQATLSISAPSGLQVHTESRNAQFTFEEASSGGIHTRKWKLEKFKSIPFESNSPAAHEVLPVLLVAASKFQVEGYNGSMDSWKTFGLFLAQLNEGMDKLSPAMAEKVRSIVNGLPDNRAKIDTLYKWMQQNIRYVSVQLGIGGWQSFNAEYVEQNKYGDCKALSTFMKGMLGEIGIESWPVVVYADEEPTLMTEHFATSYFNHMMLHIPSEDIWLECTSRYAPTGVIGRDEEGKKVLLVTPDGGQLAEIPRKASEQNRIHFFDSIYYQEGWFLHGQAMYTGNLQLGIRGQQHYLSETEKRKRFMEQFPVGILSLSALDYFADPKGSQAGRSYQMMLKQFGSGSGNRHFIPVNALHPIEFTCQAKPRVNPFVQRDDHTVIMETRIELPTGYEPEFIPEPIDIEHAVGHFKLAIEQTDSQLIVRREFQYYPVTLPASEYASVCDFFNRVRKADETRMVIVAR